MAGVKGTFFGGRCPGKVLICAQEVLNSPLLLPAKSETCKEMFSKEEFYFEYMVTCIWFPLIHESIHFWCGQRWREHGITLFPGTVFQTPGLCLDFVRFFQYETLAVLTAVEFDEASRLEQDADFWHFKAEEWRREADAAAWRRQRAAEAMAQTIEAAEEDLEKAKLLRRFEKLDEPHLSYVQGDAASQVKSVPTADVVIVDPPRKGLDEAVLQALCRSRKKKQQRLIYVSCGFPAFQRDCQKLIDAGWTVHHAEGFILFPGADRLPGLKSLAKATWGCWVVGGGDKGGILVRAGQGTSSEPWAQIDM
eukprot:g10520.t1